MSRLSKRSLRAMKRRWQVDLDRLAADYAWTNLEDSDPYSETQRNLATAIAEIDGMISRAFHPNDETPNV